MEFSDLEDDPNVVHGILSRISFLGGLNTTELSKVLSFMQVVHCTAGECIVKQGDEPSHIFIIRKGCVQLLIADKKKELSKREFCVGEHFGEVAMLTLINEHASFVALEPCEFIAFPRKAFYRLRMGDPDLFCRIVINIARDLARKVQFSDDLMLRT